MSRLSERELIEKILDEPDNDDYRLILADYYAENHLPHRAELIRAQLALRSLSETDPRAEFLYNMQEQALAQSVQLWTEELAKMVDGYSFERGLPEKISITLPKLKQHAPYLFRHFPIRSVTLLSEGFSPELLSQIPNWFEADSIQFPAGENGDEICRIISRFSGPLRVRHLGLQGLRITQQGIRALTRWPHHSQLRGLNLADNFELEMASLERFCTGDWQNLHRLDFTSCDFNPNMILRFVENWQGPQLRELILSHNPIGPTGMSILLSSPRLRQAVLAQKTLDLRRCEIDAVALEMLCSFPELEAVESLRLDRNPLRDQGFAILCRSPYLKQLRELDVPECLLTDRIAEYLEKATFIHSLKRLDIHGNTVSRQRLGALQEQLLLENWRSVIQFEGGLEESISLRNNRNLSLRRFDPPHNS
jgi:uncharacterized protein (TIGR02996 family)